MAMYSALKMVERKVVLWEKRWVVQMVALMALKRVAMMGL